ncbi:MAG: SRPBCC domain-containing protein, partial [Rhodanobacteraceae bacterium]
MSESEKEAAATVAPNELVITRLFNAPRELIFRAFTEIEEIKQWAGPRDYPCIQAEGDLRVGGKWRSCLRAR